MLMRGTKTYFEEGARDDIREHRDNGGTLLMLMTHFRRWEPLVMAQVARVNEPLKHVQYSTGITARRAMFELPVVGPLVVGNSGAQVVDRAIEHTNETPEQKAVRKEANQKTQAVGGRFLASGRNWLIFPEGGSRKIVERNGESVREEREPGVLLPLQRGFVYTLESMTPEERERVKLLGVAVHYGERLFSSFRSSVAIPRPETPVDGTGDEMFQQGEDLLSRAVADVVRLDAGR